jgi:hypothetical protein
MVLDVVRLSIHLVLMYVANVMAVVFLGNGLDAIVTLSCNLDYSKTSVTS